MSLIDDIKTIINSNPCHHWIYWAYIPIELRKQILEDYIAKFGKQIRVQNLSTKKWVIIEWDGGTFLMPFKSNQEIFDFNGENYKTNRDVLYHLDFKPICQWWIGFKIAQAWTQKGGNNGQ